MSFHAHPQRAQHDRDWNNYRAWWNADFRRFYLARKSGWKSAVARTAWEDRIRAQTRRLKVLAQREDWALHQKGTQ